MVPNCQLYALPHLYPGQHFWWLTTLETSFSLYLVTILVLHSGQRGGICADWINASKWICISLGSQTAKLDWIQCLFISPSYLDAPRVLLDGDALQVGHVHCAVLDRLLDAHVLPHEVITLVVLWTVLLITNFTIQYYNFALVLFLSSNDNNWKSRIICHAITRNNYSKSTFLVRVDAGDQEAEEGRQD